MPTRTDIKTKFGILLGSTVLATALTAVPVQIHLGDLMLGSAAAYAKGGNSGSGSDDSGSGSSNSGSGSDDDNSGSGSSNSGSGSDDDNSGSGSSNSGSGSDDDNSGSGSSNSGSGSDDDNSGSGSSNSGSGSDDDNSGRGSGNSGDASDDDRHGDRRGGRNDPGGASNTTIPAQFGFVVKAEIEGNHIEIGYSDGWKEEVEEGRYELKNPANRTVVQRPATQADINRLNATARASRL